MPPQLLVNRDEVRNLTLRRRRPRVQKLLELRVTQLLWQRPSKTLRLGLRKVLTHRRSTDAHRLANRSVRQPTLVSQS